ncbi:trypsin-like peptidase domain-containing protein [Moorena sp. SIO3H5]|uniref:trypsin-like peptidase domain-containing protein n=1 Tax=Moorena sp. SIO3H5 TaxID=2607834 RepID=UPI0013BA22A5|nr:trypsin-like peptidase domain-containing protein [Moorena sp. SIO3H5]NEO70470.1 trypsin-like serine protease [Moorena sp. SIO3H5]
MAGLKSTNYGLNYDEQLDSGLYLVTPRDDDYSEVNLGYDTLTGWRNDNVLVRVDSDYLNTGSREDKRFTIEGDYKIVVEGNSSETISNVLPEDIEDVVDVQVNSLDLATEQENGLSNLASAAESTSEELELLRQDDTNTTLTVEDQQIGIQLSAEANANPSLDGVFGDDERTRVTNTTSDPWSKVGLVTARFGNEWFGSSGVMIGPHHFLTSAHGIFDSTLSDSAGNGGYADEIYVHLGQDGQEKYYGQVGVTYFHTVNGYTADNDGDGIIADADSNEDDGNYDWAVLTLDRNIGNYTGWMGWQWNSDLSWYNDLNVNITGYPKNTINSEGIVENNWQGSFAGIDHSAEMYTISGTINSATNYQIKHHLDATGGNSGGPVWRSEGNSEYVIGLTRAGFSDRNEAIRLQEYMTDLIEDWKTNDPNPVDKPDLVDYDQWFGTDFDYLSSNSIKPGDNLTTRFVTRNNGTAASGNFDVNFYASTDNDVTNSSGSHWLLGSDTISSLDPFDWDYATWSASFPNLNPGSYYIIGFIDPSTSIDEFDDSAASNQVVFDSILQVQSLF